MLTDKLRDRHAELRRGEAEQRLTRRSRSGANTRPARSLIVLLAECLPVFGVTFVSAVTNSSWLMSMFSSSPAIMQQPGIRPRPLRIAARLDRRRVVSIDHDPRVDLSTGRSDRCSRYGLSAACALPATAAPSSAKPTISAPPPFTNDLARELLLVKKPGHHAPPFAITAAAFWIAVRILGYVPQRHRCPFIAVRIWSSDGFFVVARRSAAWIIIPFWQ